MVGEACVRWRPTRASEVERERRAERRADEGEEGTRGEGAFSPRDAVSARQVSSTHAAGCHVQREM